MLSFRAAAFNALLRATIKKTWKPDMDVALMRRNMSVVTALCRRSAEYSTLTTPGGPVDLIAANAHDDESLILLYLHGGAFSLHSPPMYRGFVTRVCQHIGASSGYLLDYRLAPEHQYPAAVNDCIETYRWLLEQPGVDPQRLVLAGDSAGGSLTMTTLMQARDQGLPLPACAVLISPFTNATGTGSSIKENEEHDVLFTPDALKAVLNWYLPESVDPTDPLISPLLGDVQGLPPMLFQVGSTEMLRDDSVQMAEKIVQSGGVADLKIWDDMPHVFQVIPWLPESDQALQQLAAFVQKHTTISLESNTSV
ncbi:MAG: alpha/beta hydrolase [Deltaproteobacteria bacterium]|nr:alpha/beta hydrolase [Deltaproteobacteria bacterium]